MPTADLRALAERLGMLKPCGCVAGCLLCGPYATETTRERLATEAEVRAAIFEAGVHWVEVGSSLTSAHVSFGGDERPRVHTYAQEATPNDLVLLALLRALDEVRRLEKRS